MDKPPSGSHQVSSVRLFVRFLLTVIFVANIPVGYGEIRFQSSKLTISSLPPGFGVSSWTVADMHGRGKRDLVVAGTWLTKSKIQSAMFVLRNKKSQLVVIDRLLCRPIPKEMGVQMRDGSQYPVGMYACPIQYLTSCDIDNNGREELFAIGYEKATHQMVRPKDDAFVEEPLPFPSLERPVLAWLDYDSDGWIDLFLGGSKAAEGDALIGVTSRLYKNQQGRFVKTDIVFDVAKGIDTAHVIDFDQNGKPDLLLCGTPIANVWPAFNRVFLNKGNNFEEIRFPLNGIDKLRGLNRASVAMADFDADGLSDLLISGSWNDQLGPKAYISLIYKKIYNRSQNAYYLVYDHTHLEQIPDIRGSFTTADLDGDGDTDIFAWGMGRDSESKVVCLEYKAGAFEPITSGPWAKSREQPFGKYYGGIVAPIDLNRDGLLDFICFPASSDKKVILLSNVSQKGLSKKED